MHRLRGQATRVAALAVGFALAAPPARAAPPEAPDPFLAVLVDRATRAEFGQSPDLFLLYLSAGKSLAPLESLAVALREKNSPRTDQQTGASSSAAGSVTLTDKPGISDLLNLAIERGAITRAVSDTTFALQTTPYLFYTKFGGDDDAEHWDRLTALRRLALSATFAATSGDENSGLSNLLSAEAKYVALGSRSARDRAFREHIKATLAPVIEREKETLRKNTKLESRWFSKLSPDVQGLLDDALIAFNNWQTEAAKPIPAAEVQRKLGELLDPIRARLNSAEISTLAATAASAVEEETVRVSLSKAIAGEAARWLPAGPQLSILYGYNRDPSTSDYSRIKVLFAYDTGERFSVNANGEVALNHSTPPGGSTVRAYAGEASLTLGRFAGNALDLTAAAKVGHAKASSLTTTAFQAKANIYVASAVIIPLALTYANHTEDSLKSKLRLNIGLALNADALLGIARAR
ncbi:MAG TPA: hypothetical protein VKH43_11390 [Thermoanaerobaculia bacterium]|nr:hypothetical protein [Thermoanaerobaculia bacterium]